MAGGSKTAGSKPLKLQFTEVKHWHLKEVLLDVLNSDRGHTKAVGLQLGGKQGTGAAYIKQRQAG